MVCLDDVPDLENLPSDVIQLQAILEKAEQQLRECKEEERRRRTEKFKAKKKQRQQQQGRPEAPAAPATPTAAATQADVEAEDELRELFDGIAAELTSAAACEDLEALRHNLTVAEEVLSMEPELSRSLIGPVETAKGNLEELERKLQREQEEEEEAEAQRRAAEAAAAAEAECADAESYTSEDRRIDAEIRELELILKRHEESKAAEEDSKSLDGGTPSACAGLRSCCSTLSFATALESLSGEGSTATGSSTTASRCTSPSSASVRLEAVPAQPAAPAQPTALAAPPPPPVGLAAEAAPGAEAEAAPASAKAPAKGQGKGKGVAPGPGGKAKGKGGAPPPPPKGGGGAPGPKAAAAKPKNNNLVHLHWKVSHEPEDLSKMNASFLQRLEDCKPDGYEYEGSEAADLLFPERPCTVFSPLAPVVMPPQEVIDYYFAKCTVRSTWTPPETNLRDASAGERHKPMLDEKRLNMLGIMIQKHLMEHKGQTNTEAILSIKRGVLRCDSSVVRLEGLSVIRTVLSQHEKDNKPVSVFVETHGEAALDSLEYPDHHRLVFELSKVPQIDERLECMLFCITFKESISGCRRSLCDLRQALDMLNSKRETIRRFFVTAHRLGQSLNRESNAPKAPNGFQLSTLEKLSQTKSTKFPKLSILHFVLALMSRKDADALFDKEDLALLQSAKALKTHKVFQDCVELAQGFYGVQQICETGKYTSPSSGQAVMIERRRLSQTPQTMRAAEPAVDTNDRFHEVMQDFVDKHLEDAEEIAEGAFNLILTYKELALYFDDLPSVYPPPKNENDPRKDLCDVFYRFAEDIRKHRDEVESERLREIIASTTCSPELAPELPLPPRSSCGNGSPPRSARALPPQLPLGSPPRTGGRNCTGSPMPSGEVSNIAGPSMQPHQLHFTPKSELDISGKSHPCSPAASFHMSGTPKRGFHNNHVDRAVANEIDLLSRTIDRANSLGGLSECGAGMAAM